MSGKAGCVWFAALLLAALAAPARAENPRVSLKVENATCAEAAAALARAANVSLQIVPPASGMQERASFDWTNTTFARALRQLCERYHLQPGRPGGTYRLFPRPESGAPQAPPRPVGLVEKDGVRLFARGIDVYENQSRRLDLLGGGPDVNGGSIMTLTIGCLLADREADAIAGFGKVVARDDAGTLLTAEPRRGAPFDDSTSATGPFPDEWSSSVSLPAPAARAKKLAWVEGELMVYRVFRRHRVEIPLPLEAKSARQQFGGAVFELTRFEAGSAGGGAQGRTAPSLQARLFVPVGSDVRIDPTFGTLPVLVGASGKIYFSTGGGSGPGVDPDGIRWNIDSRYPLANEPVVKMYFQMVERADPVRLVSFRMEDIPLPQEMAFEANRSSPRASVPSSSGRGASARAYYEKGGGILVSRIQIAGQPAGEGVLSLGLSAETGGEWTSTQWIELGVNRDGVARLEDLKPGIYRLLRVYRPKEVPNVTGPGHWVDAEVRIEVAPARETAPPPLRWTADSTDEKPAPAGAPAARPARAKATPKRPRP